MIKKKSSKNAGAPIPPPGAVASPESADVPAAESAPAPTSDAAVIPESASTPESTAPASPENPAAAQAAAPKKPVSRSKKIAIIAVAAVVVVALIGYFGYRSVAAGNASKEVHAAFDSVAATNDSFGTIVNGAGIYSIGIASDDELSESKAALSQIDEDLDSAETHLKNAESSKSLMSANDQTAYDNLETSVSARRDMADAASTIISSCDGVPEARANLAAAVDKLNAAAQDVNNSVGALNGTDISTARNDIAQASTDLAAGNASLSAAKQAYSGADYSAYDSFASGINTGISAITNACNAYDARDQAAFSSAQDAYNNNLSSMNYSYDSKYGPYMPYEKVLLQKNATAIDSFKKATSKTTDADSALSAYYGQNMGLDTFMKVS